MTTEQAIQQFIIGFLKTAALTFCICVVIYLGWDLFAIVGMGIVGGIMTMKKFEDRNE